VSARVKRGGECCRVMGAKPNQTTVGGGAPADFDDEVDGGGVEEERKGPAGFLAFCVADRSRRGLLNASVFSPSMSFAAPPWPQ